MRSKKTVSLQVQFDQRIQLARPSNMMILETIETEIQNLSTKDLSEFRRWFLAFDANTWDAQIEKDAAAGKLDALAEEALYEYRSGKVTESSNWSSGS
ncbi:MAG: hypothetical protein LGR52_07810 [Candidatus Thiosymbion ectosymbiont of Robbea hypermnestra]|nr:hypothetical protein [Candidatus Thiosymbion ectosymbiont of Robbea hypermnestra]